jgi:hypothetical protein
MKVMYQNEGGILEDIFHLTVFISMKNTLKLF